jgi:hypothetical protein
MAIEHRLATHVHKARYIQSSDPGAVGAGVEWLDTNTTPAIHKKRNATDDGWDEILDPADYALKSGATFTGDISVPDEAYDATAWNGSVEVPTKNAIRDKIESLGTLSDGDKGDITVSASGATWTIDNDAVSYAKIQDVSAESKLLGRGAGAGAGDVQELTVGTGLSMSGTTLSSSVTGVTDGDKGDITVSASGATWTVDNDAVSDAKLRDSAALSVIGRSANSTGDPADIAAGSDGHVLRRSGTTLGFGTIDAAAVGSGVFTDARLASDNDAGNSGTADTIDWSLARSQKSTLTGNVTYTFSNPVAATTYVLRVHTGAGGFTTTWPAAVHWNNGTAPTTTAAASKIDVYTFHYDGSIYIGIVSAQNVTP